LTLSRTSDRRQWARPIDPRRDSLNSLLKQDESQRLERKSSFLVPSDPTRPIPEKELQKLVGKSIVALANTEGGHVIFGQRDDKTVLGVEPDFASLKPRHQYRDGFEQRLAAYTLTIVPASVLNLTTAWLSVNGKDVLVVVVPPASLPIYHEAGRSRSLRARPRRGR